MATTRFLYEAKLERTKQNVERWISCPALKGKLVLDKVILSIVFQLKIKSSRFHATLEEKHVFSTILCD